MPLPDNVRTAKNQLSAIFLTPGRHFAIHGVGTGKVGNQYHLRIYVTDPLADVDQAVFFKLSPLGITGPPFVFNGIPIEIVKAPRAVMGANVTVPTGPPPGLPNNEDCAASKAMIKISGGVSVWRENSDKIGTITFFCISGTTKYLLSCNHVLAPDSQVMPSTGVRIMRHNGGTPAAIANLTTFKEIQSLPVGSFSPSSNLAQFPRNEIDAAIAQVKTKIGNQPISMNGYITGPAPTPKRTRFFMSSVDNFTSLDAGTKIDKHGFASCWTGGEIDDPDCDFVVLENKIIDSEALFVNQVRIIRHWTGGVNAPFATYGDSGSLIFRSDTSTTVPKYRAIGLLFAIGDKPSPLRRLDSTAETSDVDYGIANPMSVVLDLLGKKLGPNKILKLAGP